MIDAIIRYSIRNRFLVLLLTFMLVGWGIWSVQKTPIDALPDLSDVQVIVKTNFPGQAPQVVEDQVTYPLTTAMLSVPGAVTVRGYSFFGDSYVYVIFDDDTDLYWARSRVLEYLSQVTPNLPETARPQLGPDATGVGWAYMYALVDRTGQHDLSELRSLQDWFLKYELQSVSGVSEVATIGGMVKQYQVTVDPDRLRAYGIPLSHVQMAIQRANQEVGASVIEMAEAEYMVRASGYLDSRETLESVPLGQDDNGVPLLLRDVATINIGPKIRRGIAELNGEGEVVGGVIVMRFGENARQVIEGVKSRLETLKAGLPDGVELVTVYDRSQLIDSAVKNLYKKLLQEFLVVAVVCAVFLFHVRSALVAVFSLPVGILIAYIVMHLQGINANIMSLGGIAIAIGAMVDGAIVMIENMHKHMEETPLTDENRWQVVAKASSEVGPALFFSLLIITMSFLPVFTLEAQEGRMFSPLAFTKTYAMAASAILAITLVPVLMGYFVRGKVRHEAANPINRLLMALYLPVLRTVLKAPTLVLIIAVAVTAIGLLPARQIGSEFIPPLDEGDLMYMPTTYPGISIGKARELLQQTDKLIRTVPEVKTVFGKVGRADSATDPAPLTMIETVVQLHPKDQWRPGLTSEGLRAELDSLIQVPGLTNAWVMPIKTRIDMLATGIKTPVGIKIAGPELAVIEDIGRIEGLERYPVNMRYPQSYRDSPEQLEMLPLITPGGQRIALANVATVRVEDGPPGIKSENARLNGWTLVDIAGVDLGSYVKSAQMAVNDQLELPGGYSVKWSGQYEYMLRAQARLSYVIPLTLAIIVLLLYLNFKRFTEVLIILATLPVAALGGVWLMIALGYNFSIAVGVGFIALAGVAVEIGIIMLVYLNQAYVKMVDETSRLARRPTIDELKSAVLQGTGRRVRPVIMTVATIVAGLVPIMIGTGTGSEVMQRIAAPMVGGMLSATVLALLVIPAVYFLWKRREIKRLPISAIDVDLESTTRGADQNSALPGSTSLHRSS